MSKRPTSWLRELFRPTRPARKAPRAARLRPCLESLEDRCVPASFQFQDLLVAPGPGQASSIFGFAVAIDGDIAVVGEPFRNTSVGAAHVFGRNDQGTPADQSDDTWEFQVTLTASNAEETDDRFGTSVAISGGVIVVGASHESSAATGVNGDQDDNSASAAGAAYVFVDANGDGDFADAVQQAYLKASNTNAGDAFGRSVAISGDTIVVGAPFDDVINAGSVSVYGPSGANQAPTLTVPGDQIAYEDVDLPLSGISVADPDGDNLTVTLTVNHGTLTLGTTSGLTVQNNGSGTVTLSGSVADLNAALATLIYRGNLNFGGDDTLNVSVSDGSLSTQNSVAIHVKSAAEQAEDLGALVNALVADGVLNEGQGESLMIFLRDNNGDIGKVQSFLNELAAFVNAGILTQEQADPLLLLGNFLLLSVSRR